jgi:hypothetical protein
MSYADELLELAQEIANLHLDQRHQSSLRRAVSMAYYALFHLLISEATASWVRPELRSALARVFDHGPMKQAADKKMAEVMSYFDDQPVEGRERTVAYHLYSIADAFKSWNIIREEPPAQAYLVSMLPSKERRQSERWSPEKRPTLMDNPKP